MYSLRCIYKVMARKKTKGKNINRYVFATIAFLALALIIGRFYLPFWATDYVNKKINELEGYNGYVTGIGVSLWRGAYQIHGLKIFKEESDIAIPFVDIETADISVEWRALFDGAIVAEIDLYNADLNFAVSPSGTDIQTGEDAGWAGFVDTLSPLDINRFEIHSGKVAFKDFSTSPEVDIFIQDIRLQVTNLKNVKDINQPLPSPVLLYGNAIGDGTLNIQGAMNILNDVPDFDLDVKFENAYLPAINDYSRSLAAIDFTSGTLSLYSELVAKDGLLTGYVKPVAQDVRIIDITPDKNPINLLWESIVAVFASIFKNHGENQLATQIPIEGRIDSPETSIWSAFIGIFRNTFRAFTKDTDDTVDFLQAPPE